MSKYYNPWPSWSWAPCSPGKPLLSLSRPLRLHETLLGFGFVRSKLNFKMVQEGNKEIVAQVFSFVRCLLNLKMFQEFRKHEGIVQRPGQPQEPFDCIKCCKIFSFDKGKLNLKIVQEGNMEIVAKVQTD
jgi:hypothetical protein